MLVATRVNSEKDRMHLVNTSQRSYDIRMMHRKWIAVWVTAFLPILGLEGCLLGKSGNGSIRFEGVAFQDSVFLSGETYYLAGGVSSDVIIDTMMGKVFKDTQSLPEADGFAVRFGHAGKKESSWKFGDNSTLFVGIDSAIPLSRYILEVRARSGSAEAVQDLKFSINGHAWPMGTTLNSAAQGHLILGSSLDLDVPEALVTGTAITRQSDIDLVLIFSEGSCSLVSPIAAKADTSVRFTKSWDDSLLKDIRMVKLTGRISQESALQAFESGTPLPSIPLNRLDNILLRTTKSTFVRVKILELTGSGRTTEAVLNVAPFTSLQ